MSAAIMPSFIRMILSTSRYNASSRRCSIIIIVAFCRFCMSSISAIAFLPVLGSRFASGSSNRNTCTSSTMTPAIETRCFWPPESSLGELSRRSSMKTAFATDETFSRISFKAVQSFSRANATSSATVSPMNCPSVSCMTVPTILDRPWIPMPRGSIPSTRYDPVIWPENIKGTSPFMQWASVDLPEPEGPMIRTFSPAFIFRFMCLSVGSA